MPSSIGIGRILDPAAVAIVGASDSVEKFGGRVLHHVLKHGYRGAVYPINPVRASLRGLRAYPSIGAVGAPIDVAIIAVPASALAENVAACVAAGVGCCVVITAQLAEASAEGARIQDEAVAIARAGGMRILGPNCLGFVSPPAKLALTASFAMDVEGLPSGRVAVVSQSGALMATSFSRAHDVGIGFRAFVSVGNQADLEVCDFLDYFIGDDATGAICLYLEGLKDPARFVAAAAAARLAGKPLVVCKAGRSEAGVRAARSHTASLAGSSAAFQAMCQSKDVTLVDDNEMAALVAAALARWGRSPSDGIAMVSGSGGAAALGADRVVGRGLRLARLGAAAQAVLGEHAAPENRQPPLDLGAFAAAFTQPVVERCLAAVAADGDVGATVYTMTTQPLMQATAAALAGAAAASGKPVLPAVVAGRVADPARRSLVELGLPYYDRLDDALLVAEALTQPPAPAETPTRPAGAGPLTAPPAAGALTEPEAKRLLAAYGIPCTREQLVRTADEAAAAATAIGFPVALKAVARGLVHKSDVGAVRLGLADAAAVRDAFTAVSDGAGRAGGVVEGCLVQEMVGDAVAEVILGVTWDDQFGPFVLVGLGGVLVELLRDVKLLPAPAGPVAVERALRGLAGWPVLAGVRGRPAADLAAIVDAATRLGWLAADLGPRLRELDVNPLMVRARGAVAADARATILP